ncbi:hypothetical protein AM500_04570 [Bacillus sp. FJAT-18017]|nr:hypothetical protein AM500_04570 [Bacillus sp. FJAT-18017]
MDPMDMSFPELYYHLAAAPLYIFKLIFCIGFLIYSRKDKGCFFLIPKIYCVVFILNYFVALYFRFFYY